MNIKENIKLAPYTTYKIGGPAKYFVEAETREEILEALEFANNKNIKYFILCGGSNVLFPDEGYEGVVVKLNLKKLSIENNIIYAESGVKLMSLVNFGIKNDLSGLEFIAGVPGEVGGAIRGNAGAFGRSISEFIKKVEVIRENKIIELEKEEIKFDYRDSEFKRNKDIILGGYFELEKGDIEKAKKEIEKNINYRRDHHPIRPSAGSTFKNTKEMSAGRMVEELGLKGKKIGQAQISERHGNFIVNLGGAKASDVLELISLVKNKVKEKYNIELEEEIMIVK